MARLGYLSVAIVRLIPAERYEVHLYIMGIYHWASGLALGLVSGLALRLDW